MVHYFQHADLNGGHWRLDLLFPFNPYSLVFIHNKVAHAKAFFVIIKVLNILIFAGVLSWAEGGFVA
jgi:hypothetical protein